MTFLILAAFLIAQQDQTPRQPQKDARGLLKIDATFFDLAASTGGDFYFWAPGEFGSAKLQVPLHHDAVVLAYGSSEGKKIFDIPVEAGVTELTVFAGIQRKDLAVLVRPDDTVVPDVQSFQHMLIATVKTPPAGVWHLELDGAGTYAVTAHVQTGDGGPHFGSFKPSSCEGAFTNAKDVELLLVARDGSIIAKSPVGECKIPDVPYRAAIRGVDSTGAPFQRIESGLHTQEKK